MATALFKHDGFLCSSYFSDILLPDLKQQAEQDGDSLIEHNPHKDLCILEFRSDEEFFTTSLNDQMANLESCCFYEIENLEFNEILERAEQKALQAKMEAQEREARLQADLAYREAHPELYEVVRGASGENGGVLAAYTGSGQARIQSHAERVAYWNSRGD